MSENQVISAWEQDPGMGNSPYGGPVIRRPPPDVRKPPLPTRIDGDAPRADNYKPGTVGFRYWACADALRRTSDFWGSVLGPNARWNPQVGDVLPVILDEGVDLNAYYDRQALNFFHASVGDRMVYSGESPDIVCHEFGHAVLDAVRPQLWDVASFEPPAFHESFGDMSAILTALELPSVRAAVLQETGSVLYRSSRLSRLAEQLGWAIRQRHPDDVDADCLRNAVNQLFYQNPDNLPTFAPASQLCSEPHSFSRVFTAAFFHSLAMMFAASGSRTETDLLEVSRALASLLARAIRISPVVPEYYAQIAAHMVKLAGPKYEGAIKAAMVRHGILSVPGAALVAAESAAETESAERTAVGMAPAEAPAPPLQELDVSGYGLTVKKIQAVVAGENKRFRIAGAAPTAGDAPSVSGQDAARDFLEDLVRRGRLDHGKFADAKTAVVDPFTFKTHVLAQEKDQVVLRRVRIDCGFRKNARPQP